MKKQLIVALIAAAVAFPIAAQAEGAYVGGSVGRAESKFSDSGISIKDSDTGFKLNAGYDFTKNFGVEVGYADLGKPSIPGQSVSAEPSALYVAGTATLPVNDQVSVFAKAGLSANRTKVRSTGEGSDTFKHTSAIIGVGAAYNFTKNIAFVAEYENFGKTVDEQGSVLKSDLLSVGVRYKF